MRRSLLAAALTLGLTAPAWADAPGDVRQGRDALRNGDYGAVVSRLTAAIDAGTLKGDRLGEAYRIRSSAHFQLKDLRQAFADVSQALNLNGRDAAALGLRCQIHAAAGNLDAAQKDLGAAQATNAKAADAQVCQAGIAVRQRRFPDAIAAYDRAIQLGDDRLDIKANRAIAIAMSGRLPDAVAAMDQVIAGGRSAAPSQRAEWLVSRGRLLAAMGKPDLALKDLDEAIRLDPKTGEAGERHYLRARLLNDAGQHERALADLNTALQLEQQAPDARKALLFATRGTAYAGKGDYARAVADIDGAISLGKEVPPPVVASWYLIRARANRAAGHPDMALQDYAAALSVQPESVEARAERGELLLRQGKVDQALADFREAVKRAPNVPVTHSWLGWALADKGDYAQAIASASRIVELRPQDFLGYWDRGVFQFLQGRYAEATGDLDRAAAIEPRNGAAALLAHVARVRAGDRQTDLLAERAKSLDLSRPPGPLIRLFLGQASADEVLQGKEMQNPSTLFYVGQYHLIAGNTGRAAELFRMAVQTEQRQYLEHTAARAELARSRG